MSLVERHGISYHEKKLGQLFCDGSSAQIIEMLLREAGDAAVQILCGSFVSSVRGPYAPSDVDLERIRAGEVSADSTTQTTPFGIETNHGVITSQSLVVATGGLSIPPLGATDFGYRLARQFGLRVVEPWPALVPFILSPEALRELAPLSGVSIDALVNFEGNQFRENILITHRGLSGPAVLQLSSYWRPGLSITINLLPEHDALALLNDSQSKEITLANFLSQFLPRRFAAAWCALNFPSQPLKRYAKADFLAIAQRLNRWEITPAGTEGYRKAEVTAGGVATDELSSQTMEVKSIPGLYFIGEVVDVTGQLGGYNFQWAWASGYAAGQVA